MNDRQIGDEAWARAVRHVRRTWSRRPFRLSSTGMSDWKLVDRNSCLPDRDSSFSAVGEQSWLSTCLENCPLQVTCYTFSWLFLLGPAPVVWWAMLELGPACSVSQVMHRRSLRSPPLLRVGSLIGLETAWARSLVGWHLTWTGEFCWPCSEKSLQIHLEKICSPMSHWVDWEAHRFSTRVLQGLSCLKILFQLSTLNRRPTDV